jgi:hypothetical protein
MNLTQIFLGFLAALAIGYAAWVPISLGIQALHRKQEGKNWACLGILLAAWGGNLMMFALIAWKK